MLKNNQFTSDTDLDRLERLLALSANIDTYAVELGVEGDELTWAQGAGAAWEAADAAAVVEDGQMDDAFETFEQKTKEVYSYYTGAREMLMAYITQFENPNDLAKAYGFEGDSPRTGRGLIAAISAWKDQHDFMIAEGLTPIVNDTVMTKLLDFEQELKVSLDNTKLEKLDSRAAYKAKAALFSIDSKKLTILFNKAKFTWGADDDRLGVIGFVPASEVHTPGQPEPGTPVHPEPVDLTVTYLGQKIVEVKYGPEVGAVSATIRRAKSGAANYVIIAQGLPMDENRVPYRDTDVPPGDYDYEVVTYNEANEPSVAAYATVTVPEEIPA